MPEAEEQRAAGMFAGSQPQRSARQLRMTSSADPEVNHKPGRVAKDSEQLCAGVGWHNLEALIRCSPTVRRSPFVRPSSSEVDEFASEDKGLRRLKQAGGLSSSSLQTSSSGQQACAAFIRRA